MTSVAKSANKDKVVLSKPEFSRKALFFLLLVLVLGLAFFSVRYSWRLADQNSSVDLFNFIEERLTNLSSS